MEPSHQDKIVGIDLGTTHSSIGIIDSGFAILLADKEGKRLFPSVVSFSNGVEVGNKALEQHQNSPKLTVKSVKRLMGRSLFELEENLPRGSWKLKEDKQGRIQIDLGEMRRSPEEVSAEILKHLKQVAESQMGYRLDRAVITVPAYFHEAQRQATKRAAELVGWKVERLLAEPTAAALAYGLDRLKEKAKVMVYDLGGGTFDVSVLEWSNGVFQVLATQGDNQLGGDDFDYVLAKWLWKKNQTTGSLESYVSLAEKIKQELSQKERVKVVLPKELRNDFEGVEVTRDQFNKLIEKLLNQTGDLCQKVLGEADLKSQDLQAIVLVGGSTRIPLVAEKLNKWFGIEPDLSAHPDEAVAIGATIQAGILGGELKKVLLLDVLPLSLGIETYGGLMNVLIPRNTTIPCRAGEMFCNALENQTSMSIRVLQGERELAKDNWQLGAIEVPFEKAPKGQARVGVQFSIDEDGLLEVLVREMSTGEDRVLRVENSAVSIKDQQVEEMIRESVDHALEDFTGRQLVELKLKGEELIEAVEVAISQLKEVLESGRKQEIEQASIKVKNDLKGDNLETLKSSINCLDEMTQTLATELIDWANQQAFEAQLELS